MVAFSAHAPEIDSADNKSIDLQCGEYAETLTVIENGTLVTAKSAL